MTTQRWMVFIAVFAANFAACTLYRRWGTVKVAGFLEGKRKQAGLPRTANLGDFNVSGTRDMVFWMDVDHLLERFWSILVFLAVVFSVAVAAMVPRGGVVNAVAAAPPCHSP